MLKRLSLGFGILAIVITAGMLVVPEKAEARVCKVTFIPQGFVPTGQFGCSTCPSEIFENSRLGTQICVVLSGSAF